MQNISHWSREGFSSSKIMYSTPNPVSTVSQFDMKILKPIHLIQAHLPPSLRLPPLFSSNGGIDTWTPLWLMYHTRLNGFARLTDNSPLCFVLLCDTLKSHLLPDLLNRPAMVPPTSLPWWTVIVIERFGGTSDSGRLGNLGALLSWAPQKADRSEF